MTRSGRLCAGGRSFSVKSLAASFVVADVPKTPSQGVATDMGNLFQHGPDQVREIEVDMGPASRGEIRYFTPGRGRLEWFKKIEIGPETIVVAAGSFVVGAADDDVGISFKSERPAHRVTIGSPFAFSHFTITFDEWNGAAARDGVRQLPNYKD